MKDNLFIYFSYKTVHSLLQATQKWTTCSTENIMIQEDNSHIA